MKITCANPDCPKQFECPDNEGAPTLQLIKCTDCGERFHVITGHMKVTLKPGQRMGVIEPKDTTDKKSLIHCNNKD